MTDKEREILRLMYDLHIEHLHYQGELIAGLKQAVEGARQAVDGATRAIESVERSHAILVKIMKATGDLMGTN